MYFPQKEFFGGDVLNGYAELKAAKPVETYGVKLELFGMEYALFQGKSEMNEFYKFNQILQGPGSKDRGRDWLGFKKRKVETVPTGAHKYPFNIKLPDILPPTFKSDSNSVGASASVEYELRITLESGNANQSDLVSSARVPIGGTMFDINFLGNNSTPFVAQESKSFLLSKGSMDINVSLQSKCFLNGDAVQPKIDVKNTTSKQATNAVIKLIQRIDVLHSNRLVTCIENVLSKASLGTIQANNESHYQPQLAIPSSCPESIFYRRIESGAVGRVVQINYYLVIRGDITMGTDLDFSIQLFIIRRRNQAASLNQNPPPTQQVQQAQQAPPYQTAPAYQAYKPPANQANPPQYPFGQPQYVPEQLPYGANQYPGPTNYYQAPQQQTSSVPPSNVVLPSPPAHLQQQRQQPLQQQSSRQQHAPQYAAPAPNVPPPPYAVTPQRNQPAQQQYNQPPQHQYNQLPQCPYTQSSQQQYNESNQYNQQFSSDEPQLQPLYEVPSFYPTIDDMDIASYNPNYDGPIPNTNQISSAPSTNNKQLSFDSLIQKQLSDQQQQQHQAGGKDNNGQTYDQFFE